MKLAEEDITIDIKALGTLWQNMCNKHHRTQDSVPCLDLNQTILFKYGS